MGAAGAGAAGAGAAGAGAAGAGAAALSRAAKSSLASPAVSSGKLSAASGATVSAWSRAFRASLAFPTGALSGALLSSAESGAAVFALMAERLIPTLLRVLSMKAFKLSLNAVVSKAGFCAVGMLDFTVSR